VPLDAWKSGMVIGICRLELMIRENHSLKEKRRIVKQIVDRVKHRFNVSIAEVGNNDLWQSAELGICMVSNDRRFTNQALDKIVDFIESMTSADVIKSEMEILTI
jgi:uncharacterized protein YlxP (DUF503 family)